MVTVSYTNIGSVLLNLSKPHYKYRALRIPESDYKVIERIEKDEIRILRKRFGIHIKFVITGRERKDGVGFDCI